MTRGGAWLTLALLGAFHGLNPAMGWLFAVALGLQDRRRWSVIRALPPIALGHAASIAALVLALTLAQRIVPTDALRWIGAGALVAFGLVMLGRHVVRPGRVGMRVGFRDLTLWSFLTSSAHGAGLMLVPVALRLAPGHPSSGAPPLAATHAHAPGGGADPMAVSAMPPTTAAAVVGVHTAAMLVTMAAVAFVVYEVVGLEFLRRAWINLDLLWAAALIGAGVVTLLV